jgi:small-conductance mechanosensitive channel
MDGLTGWLERITSMSVATQNKIVISAATILVLVLVRRLVLLYVRRNFDDIQVQYHVRKISLYIAYFLAILIMSWVWFRGLRALTTYFGLLSAGLAIALRDPLVNLAGWVFILWRKPFEVGDRIAMGDHAGDVIDTRIFQFTLMEIGNWVAADQSTGRVIHVPNGKVFTETLANYTKGFQYIWNEVPVMVTFESDWEKAKRIMMEIGDKHAIHDVKARNQLQKAARKFMIFYATLTPTVYTSVADSGVLLTLRYLCHPRQRRGTAQAIWEDVLREFAQCDDIDFAYPTQRFYHNLQEGKSGRVRPIEPIPQPDESLND